MRRQKKLKFGNEEGVELCTEEELIVAIARIKETVTNLQTGIKTLDDREAELNANLEAVAKVICDLEDAVSKNMNSIRYLRLLLVLLCTFYLCNICF